MWFFTGWPRQAPGAVKQVSPYVRVLTARVMWEEGQSPCDVDRGLRERAEVGSGGHGPERDYNKKGEDVREASSGFAQGSRFLSQSVRSHGGRIPPRGNVLKSSSRSFW